MFTLGSLYLQDSEKAKFKTYRETRKLWGILHAQYAEYLKFEPTEITTDAGPELVGKLSEVVGIGLGMAAMVAEFNVNLNRFNKFMAPGWGYKRVDFEYYAGSQRFFHETKGTTGEQTATAMRYDIDQKKSDSLAYVAGKQQTGSTAQPVGISGSTGSIALYRKISNKEPLTRIILVDPPAADVENARPGSEADELACVLRYYRNFYKVTHPAMENLPGPSIAKWLDEVASGLSLGQSAPRAAPLNLQVRPHMGVPDRPDLAYQGTVFDARITWRNVAKSPSLEAATAKIHHPVTFLGVSKAVTELIISCNWKDLLSFHDRGEITNEVEGLDISGSGIMSMRLEPESFNEESKKAFLSMKKVLERQHNRR